MTDFLDTVPTRDDVTRAELAQIRSDAAALLRQCVAFNNNLMARFWKNHAGVTPEEFVAALGTSAASLFGRAKALRDFAAAVRPDVVPKLTAAPDDVAVTVNPDGTVTLARKS